MGSSLQELAVASVTGASTMRALVGLYPRMRYRASWLRSSQRSPKSESGSSPTSSATAAPTAALHRYRGHKSLIGLSAPHHIGPRTTGTWALHRISPSSPTVHR